MLTVQPRHMPTSDSASQAGSTAPTRLHRLKRAGNMCKKGQDSFLLGMEWMTIKTLCLRLLEGQPACGMPYRYVHRSWQGRFVLISFQRPPEFSQLTSIINCSCGWKRRETCTASRSIVRRSTVVGSWQKCGQSWRHFPLVLVRSEAYYFEQLVTNHGRLSTRLAPCLVPRKFYKIFHIFRHIESLDACMEY